MQEQRRNSVRSPKAFKYKPKEMHHAPEAYSKLRRIGIVDTRTKDLEYKIIRNPETVDLLVSLMYSAASAEGVVDESFPIGMALRVPLPDKACVIATPIAGPYGHYCDYDGRL
ncbi:hypothetical protein DFH09DRAFT_1360097 [Mycena vulgaris]|nr:hypothetical protein DFH09DRAFT_1360097 [Mycena vulgaris]